MSGELVWAVVRLVVALPVVLGLAYLVIKYGLARRPLVMPAGRRIKVLEQIPLGPKAFLSLISLGGRYYLLAHHDGGVTILKELEELPEPEDFKAAEIIEITPRTVEEFDRLQRAGGRVGRGPAVAPAGGWGEWLREAAKKVAGGRRPGAGWGRKAPQAGGKK